MNITIVRSIPLNELRENFRSYLQERGYNSNTVGTMVSDSIYLLRKEGEDVFWNVIASDDFENVARATIIKTLSAYSKGDPKSLVNDYLASMRRFREFLEMLNSISKKVEVKDKNTKVAKKENMILPKPSSEQLEKYLKKWDALENYHLQEDALDKLFLELCPTNTDLSDILIKASTLNDFYSTNIFWIYPVAKHIHGLNIDDRLKVGDVTLVNDVMQITIDGKQKNFYSFATKYCSHHKPLDYPIYDSYVEKVLIYFRNKDGFSNFAISELKNYSRFKDILIEFSNFYELDQYNLKLIDKYIWQLGKEFFPRSFKKKKKEAK